MEEDYLKTLLQLEKRSFWRQACIQYLAASRWPDGWSCPRRALAGVWAAQDSVDHAA